MPIFTILSQVDNDGYYYIDRQKVYQYQHKYIDGLDEIWSNWQELNAYNYARKFNVRIAQTRKQEL